MFSKTEIKKLLEEKDLKVLKRLGQNFLIDEKVLNEIIRASELNKDDFILEIGPGLGTLTDELVKKCGTVVAIEKDKKMAELIFKEAELPIGSSASRAFLKIINDDILKINLNKLIEEYSKNKKYKLISNIPYYITSPVIKLFLENSIQPELIVLLVQKEVAERICAKPGKLSILALSVQIYGEPEIVSYVDKAAFYPEPKVDSAILKIKNIKKEFSEEYYKKLFKIIKIGFSSKRKKLANNLSAGLYLTKKESEDILQQSNINLNTRAQELSLEEWDKLVKLTLLK
ncbi:MAG: ribosomal RNA small subunit methyltransferase A [Candidatus Pacebacteria bacterium]|nr:ribosomal RNA small subunit methyltransferase A [Candidatus Paceibacterota bacterium]